MIVTDYKWERKNGEKVKGYYMDGYLVQNLMGIPAYLNKAWDVVGIVSGHGKVRIGKSTMGSQVGYLIAWLLAGGKISFNKEGKMIKQEHPKKEVRFNLKENYAFSAETLQETALHLYEKYGKNQVIVYDEGRQGLDSKRAMESVNKGMEDFFQECGYMGHVIIIVLPNFFKLHEDYAVARSLFLIDVHSNEKHDRGFFRFYNDLRKEQLFYFGRRLIGVRARYNVTRPNFIGRFGKLFPFDKDEYDKLKTESIEKKRMSKGDKRMKMQRDIVIWR